jgi:ribonucleoside-diphosphate reductase alpha chain
MELNNVVNIDDLPEYFVASDKIDWTKRVKLQGTIQQYIDHSISSTINLPQGTESEIVGKLYLEAWKNGCKGITVYVDGSRDGVLLETKKENKECIIFFFSCI